MIKLKDLLNENKNSEYYDFQIRIPYDNPHDDMITYDYFDGRIRKFATTRVGNPIVHTYKSVPAMVKAALKKATSDSEILIRDDSGKGKIYPFNKQSIKKIKK
tara:strand:- start:34 stop:342 length:309 start_codon:yes stop_codon:yes gene_type:complete